MSNTEKKKIGSSSPLFRGTTSDGNALPDGKDLALLLEGNLALATADNTSTSSPKGDVDTVEDSEKLRAAIHMDATVFGFGCCCLQITFQGKDLDESRFMYDQLAVMAPIMMALTASTPVLRGRLADTDARWGVISECCDDRTKAERGRPNPAPSQDELAGKGQRRIYKSRYDSISAYIYQGAVNSKENGVNGETVGMSNRVLNMYNDIPVPIDEESYKLLRDAGIDPALSQHIAHLFIRDPLVVFDGAVEEVNDETQTDHFESIQSTNW